MKVKPIKKGGHYYKCLDTFKPIGKSNIKRFSMFGNKLIEIVFINGDVNYNKIENGWEYLFLNYGIEEYKI